MRRLCCVYGIDWLFIYIMGQLKVRERDNRAMWSYFFFIFIFASMYKRFCFTLHMLDLFNFIEICGETKQQQQQMKHVHITKTITLQRTTLYNHKIAERREKEKRAASIENEMENSATPTHISNIFIIDMFETFLDWNNFFFFFFFFLYFVDAVAADARYLSFILLSSLSFSISVFSLNLITIMIARCVHVAITGECYGFSFIIHYLCTHLLLFHALVAAHGLYVHIFVPKQNGTKIW